MQHKLSLVIIVILSLLGGNVVSAEENIASNQIAPPAPFNLLEFKLLEQKVGVLAKTNTSILNTVYFTLGGLGTFILAIIGLNFFQNFSLNNRKIESIKTELDNLIELKFSNVNNTAAKKFIELEEKHKTIIKRSTESFESRTQDQIDALKTDIETKYKEINDKVGELNRDILIKNALEHKKMGQAGYMHKLMVVLDNDIAKGWQFRIASSIKLIEECLDSTSASADTLATLQSILDKLPGEYKVHKKHIESKMKIS